MSSGKNAKKDPKAQLEEFKKPVLKISLGTTKRILSKEACESDRIWLNGYIENKVAGECLPPTLYSNECSSILKRIYGVNFDHELEKIRADWKNQNGY